MSSPIALQGGARGIVSEALITLRKYDKQIKAVTAEVEATIQSAARLQGIDLTTHVLDADTLDFIERPAPPEVQAAQPVPEVLEAPSV